MVDPFERIVDEVIDFIQPSVLAERLHLGPVGILLFTRFSGPVLLGTLRWVRRHPAVAVAGTVAVGAGWYFLQSENRKIRTAQRIAAT